MYLAAWAAERRKGKTKGRLDPSIWKCLKMDSNQKWPFMILSSLTVLVPMDTRPNWAFEHATKPHKSYCLPTNTECNWWINPLNVLNMMFKFWSCVHLTNIILNSIGSTMIINCQHYPNDWNWNVLYISINKIKWVITSVPIW